MPICYLEKDVTEVKIGIVAHGVNCQYTMGSGVALAIKKKWPKAFREYMKNVGGIGLIGQCQIVEVDENLHVANCYTQKYYGRDGARYAIPEAIYSSLYDLAISDLAQELPIYMPRIGCDRGGLDWDGDVLPALRMVDSITEVNFIVCDWS